MLFSVEPNILNFPFNEINTEEDYTKIRFTKTLKLRNTSGEKCRFSIHVLQEQKDFQVVQIKSGAVFPGKYEKVIVQFSPKLWKVSQTVFYVKASKSADMIAVTLTGFPHLAKLKIPKGINFGHAVLYEPKEKIITIENDIPVDFHYDITLNRELPLNYFFVSPMKGIIRGLEKLEISISFIPLSLCQAQMDLIFRTSEYNFQPIKCLVFGAGILEIPTELPVKQVLNPIAPKTTGEKVVASPLAKKENSIHLIEMPTLEKESVRQKTNTVDEFTAELESNIAFIRNSELRRFVSIGKDTPKETIGEVIEMRNRPLSGLRLSASVDISKFRIETPAIHENANLSQSLYDRNGNRLLQLFLKAIYKVIFRIRADKRMRQLKDYISGVSSEKIAPAAEKKFDHHYQAKSKKVQQKSVIPIIKKVIYPVNVPPLPDLMKPRPIALLEPSYAEKKGFVKFPIPDEDNIFNIQVPKLQFDCKTEAEIDTAFEGVYQPTIPEIEITSYTNLDLYNPLPGVANMYIPHITPRDESSLPHIFRTSASVNISSYPGLSDLEVNLKRSTREMGIVLGLELFQSYGTRLRPLTFSKPKPLVEFANRPMIIHQIEALAKIGVKEIVLAVNYQPEVMVQAMQQVEAEFKLKITFSIEDEPLGTAGPLSLARGVLGMDDSPFFVLNSDVICEFPFKSLLEFHKAHGAEGTLMTTPVEDPSKYGVICFKSGTTQVERFVEKPANWVGDQINAGIYIFNPSILKRIDHLKGPMSIEKEVFPKMARDGQLHATPLAGFWADVGQPKDFLTGTALYLNSLFQQNSSELNTGDNIVGNVMIHPSVKIGPGCKIGPNVVIGPNATIGTGVRLSDTVLMAGVTVKDFSWIKGSIVGWHSSVGRWARLDATTVLGEDVHVKDEVFTNGATVLPHKSVGANILTPQIVM